MKIINKILILVLFGFVLASCDSTFLDVNENPNEPTNVPANLLLPVAQDYSAKSISSYDRRGLNTLGNMFMYNWSQSDGYSWYNDEFQYAINSTFYSTIWDYTYGRALKQYQAIDNPEFGNNYVAIAKIMKSLHFQTLVDVYGDIPYSEALLRGENPTPKYDNAEDIYDDLIVVLDNAINMIKNAPATDPVPSSDDIIFGGNMTDWIKLANTIKLRILVRESDLTSKAAYVSTELANINAEGTGFITSDVVANPGYVQEENKQSPFWNNYGQDTSGAYINNYKATCATDFVLNKLTSLSDNRIDYIYQIPANGPHKGVPQGWTSYPDDYTFGWVSNIGPGLLKGPGQDAVIFALSDAFFLQAEAQMKGMLPGDPKTSFDSGVAASFNYLGASGAATYTSSGNPLTDYSASTNKLETIMVQKWIALNGIDAAQSWFDYSRTGYPSDLPISLMSPSSNRPVRLIYPASEITNNGANVPAQHDPFNDKIFWAN